MHLLTLGLNHTTAPLSLRERVAFPAERLQQALSDLRTRLAPVVPESAILSTCNRTEIYCATPDSQAAQGALVGWLTQGNGLATADLDTHLYTLPQHDAVRHAFRVASGLDSMVIGEPQILGQMKDAARVAADAGAMGTHLHQLFQRSFSVAKEVRSQTEIGGASVSMAAAAVRLAQRIFEDLGEADVLFVGAGEMIELCATHFAAHKPRSIVVANRTIERAESLAKRFGGRAMRLAELPEQLERFDVVVSCTASTLPIIGMGLVERASKARRRRPIFMVDLAVPRDIEPEVAGLSDVFLYTVDDLGRVVQGGVESRLAAVAQAEAIIDTRVESFMQWMSQRRAVPVLRALQERSDELRAVELERARRAIARGEPVDAVLEAMSQALANKLLHGPRTMLSSGRVPADDAGRVIDEWLPRPHAAR